jgi:DNA-3-methyladenine glycosylase I
LDKKYHDEEWGREVHDDRVFFEFLTLEWAQAGLSWTTILNKRENYRKAFDSFDYERIAKYSEEKILDLLQDEWIVRNKLKVRSTVKNAQVFIQIQEEFGSFDAYIWDFVWNKQIVNSWGKMSEVPASTELSDAISKDLKKRGMSFVGTTIMYAFMQATWLVNDHTTDCFCYG